MHVKVVSSMRESESIEVADNTNQNARIEELVQICCNILMSLIGLLHLTEHRFVENCLSGIVEEVSV